MTTETDKADARRILPILVKQANLGETIPYGCLSHKLKLQTGKNIPPQSMGKPLEVVGELLDDLVEKSGKEISPIEILGVNAKTGIPTKPYSKFPRIGAKRKDESEKDFFARKNQEIYEYDWNWVLNELGL